MNLKLDEFKSWIKNQRVAVLGVGISNRPLIRYIHNLGARVTAFDMLDDDDVVLKRTREDFESAGIEIEWSVGADYLTNLKGFDLIFRTPKMRPDVKELLAERERGAVITSEMEVFMELCPAKMFAITGSDGKTTTTTLVSLILKQAGYQVYLGGNIGTPLMDQIDHIRTEDMVVLELSSFQLSSMRISPAVAIITNVTPNHLDVHKDYQEYIDAKRNIYLYQSFMGRLVLNANNYVTRSMVVEARGQVIQFARKEAGITCGAVVKDGWLCYRADNQDTPIVETAAIVIPGKHNIENYLAATAATWPFVKARDIATVATTFGGVEHRLELVRELNTVRYYNSSIDTSPTRTKAALNALAERHEKVVLITGGKDKKSDYIGLGEAIAAVSKKIILCGDNAGLIRNNLILEAPFKNVDPQTLQILEVQTYEEAVLLAHKIAESGEIVVLSPAGTSYDKFRHFEERGNLFKTLVNALN
ncbi:MAG: UDP-N-acetylmuramoyl-L-alanine--D-glutamate ligase [Eubacteriales bacterium]|nr:UDP-N-acetylmuramoyl-L-alanine--D-glutamate ligase [Eubacteriales bacterium]